MLFVLTKVLTHLITPLGLSMLGGCFALLLCLLGRRKLGYALSAASLLWLWLWSAPVFVDRLGAWVESQAPAAVIEKMPAADAIVLLGGGVRTTHPPRPLPEVRTTGARVFQAARLYKAGKAPKIITTGGPGLGYPEDTETEAEATRTLLVELGVPQEAVLLESKSMDTRENARFSKPLLDQLGCKRLILVTSALHMPRALREFQGICPEVIAGTTDYEFSTDRPQSVLNWVPSYITLDVGCRMFKEMLGRGEQAVAFWFNPSPFG